MKARDAILQRLREGAPSARPLPDVSALSAGHPAAAQAPSGPALWPQFVTALRRMGGHGLERDAALTLEQQVRGLFPDAGVFVSATHEVHGTRPLASADGDPRALEDVDVGIVRASFGVAETGSVALSDQELGLAALGFLSQHLVVLLDPASLLPDLHAAYRQRGFFAAGYATLLSGPSATADIEGVLIRGAQGVRSFHVIACAA